MHLTRCIYLLVCLLAAPAAWGQTAVTEPDSVKVAATLQKWLKADYDDRQQPDVLSLDRYAFLAAQKGWKELEPALNRELGVYYRETGQPESARFWFQRFYNNNAERQDSIGLALALAHLGNNCMTQGDHKNALEYNLAALGIRWRHRDREEPVKLANSYMFVGVSLARMGQYERAKEYYQKSLDIRLHQTDSTGYALLMANMGSLEFAKGNEPLGLQYYGKSFRFRSNRITPCSWGAFYLDRAEALSHAGKVDAALLLLDSCLVMYDSCPRPRKQADALFEKGKIMLEKGDFESAERQITAANALLLKWKAYHRVADIYRSFFQSALEKGRKDKALEYFELYERYRDSVAIRQNDRSLSRLQIQQELLGKTEAIQQLNRQNEARTRQRNLLLLGLVAAVFIIGIAYWLNRSRMQAFLRMREQKRRAEQLVQEKEQLLEDLRTAQQQLVQQEKMAALGQLTAGIAHELNNPLNFILNNAATLQQDYEEWKERQAAGGGAELDDLEQEIKQLIADIEHGGKRMRNIVQELSQFSRTDAGELENVAVADVIAEALHLLHIRGNGSWQVESNIPPEVPLIGGHSGKLVQLFSNLIANAFDALEARWGLGGAGKVTISATVEGDEVHIRVADNGVGMSEETRQKLFDPFFTTKPVGKGTGLGLSIAFAIARAHRGRIEVESKEGMGTTFVVVFPAG